MNENTTVWHLRRWPRTHLRQRAHYTIERHENGKHHRLIAVIAAGAAGDENRLKHAGATFSSARQADGVMGSLLAARGNGAQHVLADGLVDVPNAICDAMARDSAQAAAIFAPAAF